jgi:Leucine-rich repeat (LRR) protein
MRHTLKIGLFCLILAFLSACETYDFSVNEKLVYTPKPLFTDYSIADPALLACVKQAVSDGKIASASQLDTLSCNNAGISSLAGLEVFTGLNRLNLADNSLRDIATLAALSSLVELNLDGNGIIDTTPLLELPALVELNLNNNPQMLCPADSSLLLVKTLTLPEQCRGR